MKSLRVACAAMFLASAVAVTGCSSDTKPDGGSATPAATDGGGSGDNAGSEQKADSEAKPNGSGDK